MRLGVKRFRMDKGRMEAFSDGVLAIIITIMVLELAVPHGADLAALLPVAPIFLSYVLISSLTGASKRPWRHRVSDYYDPGTVHNAPISPLAHLPAQSRQSA
jgi:hypothetical protein